jgi:hypothetical protein
MRLRFNVIGKTRPDSFIFRDDDGGDYVEARTARFCKLHVCDGKITAEYLL